MSHWQHSNVRSIDDGLIQRFTELVEPCAAHRRVPDLILPHFQRNLRAFNMASNVYQESAHLENSSKVVIMLEPVESKQTLDKFLEVWELEEGVDGGYRILNLGGTRGTCSFADDFVVLPIGKSSVSYSCAMLSGETAY